MERVQSTNAASIAHGRLQGRASLALRPGRRGVAAFLLVGAGMLVGCSDSSATDAGPCEPGPYFTELPVDAGAISWFLVLGQFNPPGDIVPRPQTGLQLTSPALTPLRAIGDIDIVHIESSRWLASPTREGHVDYSLSFEVPACREIFGNFEHIAVLEPELEAHLAGASCEVYSTESETLEACGRRVRIPVAAGQPLGQAGGATTGLDFDLFDRRVRFDYVAGHRYPQARWAICPQHLFVPAHRDFLLARTGRGEERRTAEPVCGTMEIDVAGTAQGMWVLDGNDVTFSSATHQLFFALARHDVHADTHQVLVTAHPAFRHPSWGPIVVSFPVEAGGRVNRAWRDLPADGTIYCLVPETAQGHFPVTDASYLAAFDADGKVTLERKSHAPGESPCLTESPEAWAFSASAIKLMR